MRAAVRMEWTKLRTDPATGWCALALIAGTVVASGFAEWTTYAHDCAPRPCTVDATRLSLSGLYVGQIGVVVLAILAISREYETAMIRSTLAAHPRRFLIVIGKAGVIVAFVAVAAAITVAFVFIENRVILPGRGFAQLPAGRAYAGSVLYLTAVAALSLGVGLVVRHTGAAIATTLGLLYVAPIAALFVTDPDWQDRIRRYAPMTAGLGWLTAYAAVVLVAGAVLFRYRDA